VIHDCQNFLSFYEDTFHLSSLEAEITPLQLTLEAVPWQPRSRSMIVDSATWLRFLSWLFEELESLTTVTPTVRARTAIARLELSGTAQRWLPAGLVQLESWSKTGIIAAVKKESSRRDEPMPLMREGRHQGEKFGRQPGGARPRGTRKSPITSPARGAPHHQLKPSTRNRDAENRITLGRTAPKICSFKFPTNNIQTQS
jgi:hypothetical protein